MKKLACIFFAIFSLLALKLCFAQDEDGIPLPFLEQWNTGTFATNNWQPEAENWSVNGNEGNPDPCAEFTWDPIQSDYSIALESDQFLADYMTEGRIYLDFDIRLDDFSGDGLEHMNVQVWNWDSQAWTTVHTYSNDEGSFDWLSERLDITNQAKGKVFKVRFTAQGENSLHIVSWFIDNVHVYRICIGVSELTAECDTNLNAIRLYWTGPGGSDEWVHWDDGVNSWNAMGTGAAAEFDVAARWEPAQLAFYEGASITEIAFFPAELQCTYNLRVWVGQMAELMVVDQPVPDPMIGTWNYVTLTTPLPLDITQELWVGYNVNAQTGFPAGVDDGPAIDGYGNMINFGGWQTSLELNPEYDFNWNIAAHLVTETGKFKMLNNGSRDLMGYNVYRSIDGGGYELIDFISGNTYLDTGGEPNSGSLYCFMVTAVYESATDQCESEFSNEACVICWTDVPEEISEIDLKIYPNPASDVLFIESSEEIESISIFDSRGITIEHWNNGTMEPWNPGTLKIPVNGLAPGLYLVKVDLGDEIISRKIIVKH